MFCLKTGDPAAHPQICLMLLGSPPDMIHRGELRRTHLSTALHGCGDTNFVLRLAYHPCWSGLQVQGTANSPDSMAIFHIPFIKTVYHKKVIFARAFFKITGKTGSFSVCVFACGKKNHEKKRVKYIDKAGERRYNKAYRKYPPKIMLRNRLYENTAAQMFSGRNIRLQADRKYPPKIMLSNRLYENTAAQMFSERNIRLQAYRKYPPKIMLRNWLYENTAAQMFSERNIRLQAYRKYSLKIMLSNRLYENTAVQMFSERNIRLQVYRKYPLK